MGKLGWFMSRTQTLTSPPREGEPAGTVDHEYTTIFDFCTYSREINGVFPDFTHTHTRTKLYHWLFHGHCPSEVFQTLQGYNLAWGLEVWWLWPCFKVTAVSESPTANCCLDSCPLWFKRGSYIHKKIKIKNQAEHAFCDWCLFKRHNFSSFFFFPILHSIVKRLNICSSC